MTEANSILVLVLGTLVFTIFAVFIIVYIALHKKKLYRHEIEKKEMQHQFNQELMQSKLEVNEQILKNISSELHDNVAQVLGMAKMQLHLLSGKVIDNPSKKMAEETSTLVGDAIKEIRSLSHTMNGDYILKAGLKECIEKDLKRIADAKRIKCKYISKGDVYEIGKDKELMLFRIVQECVTNAVKHGEPYEIMVSMNYEPDMLQATIVDDGKGMDTTQKGEGMGLGNIRERVRLLKGVVTISSEIDKGTTILIRIPA